MMRKNPDAPASKPSNSGPNPANNHINMCAIVYPTSGKVPGGVLCMAVDVVARP